MNINSLKRFLYILFIQAKKNEQTKVSSLEGGIGEVFVCLFGA